MIVSAEEAPPFILAQGHIYVTPAMLGLVRNQGPAGKALTLLKSFHRQKKEMRWLFAISFMTSVGVPPPRS